MFSFTKSVGITAAVLSLVASTSADYAANAKTNVALYWGSTGGTQQRLAAYCQEASSADVIPIAFVYKFPEQTGNIYPATDFSNACNGSTFRLPNGQLSQLDSGCNQISQDIPICQALGKKILLSLGGGTSTYGLASPTDALTFSNTLWKAFGPLDKTSAVARPFDVFQPGVVVDGFDFDIEHTTDDTTYYKVMIDNFRAQFPTAGKTMYITGAPQCVVPDTNMADMITNSVFDMLFIQYYNTPQCSARSWVTANPTYTVGGVQHASGFNTSYHAWKDFTAKGLSAGAKLYIGLPGEFSATSPFPDHYLDAATEVAPLLEAYLCDSQFGGIMIWDAASGQRNKNAAGVDYQAQIKQLLLADSVDTKDFSCATRVSSSTTTSRATSTSPSALCTGTAVSTCPKKYTVVSGDICFNIAKNNLISVDQLRSFNPTLNLGSGDSCPIFPGEILCVSQPVLTSPTVACSTSSVAPLTTSSSSSSSLSHTSSASVSSTSASSSSLSHTSSASVSSTSASSSSLSHTSSASVSSTSASSSSLSQTSSVSVSSTSASSSSLSHTSSASVSSTSASSSSLSQTSSVSVSSTSASSSSLSQTSSVSVSSTLASSSSLSQTSSASVSSTSASSSSLSQTSSASLSSTSASSSSLSVTLSSSSSSTLSSSSISSTSAQITSSSTSTSSSTRLTTSSISVQSSTSSSNNSTRPTSSHSPNSSLSSAITTSSYGPSVGLTSSASLSRAPYANSTTRASATIPSSSGSVVFATSQKSTTKYTTSTVYSTTVYTLTQCPPSVTNCAVGSIITETISLYTTICPVTAAEATPTVKPILPPGSGPASKTPLVPVYLASSSSPVAAPAPSGPPAKEVSSETTKYVTVTVPKASITVEVLSLTSITPIGEVTGVGSSSVVYVVQTLTVLPSPAGTAGSPVGTGSATSPAGAKFTGGAEGLRASGLAMGLIIGFVGLLML